MRFADATGRKIVSTSSAETLGTVSEFVVDPATRSVLAVLVKKGPAGVLHWGDLTAFGADAVTVDARSRLTEADERVAGLTGKDHRLLGKRVLTTAGVELGKVGDVEFDAASGAVVSLELGADSVPGDRLVGVGSWAVVVRP